MCLALPFHLEQTEGIENLRRIGSENFLGQQIGSRAIECECRGLFGVEPMLADRILQNDQILLSSHIHRSQPAKDKKYRNPTNLLRRPAHVGCENKNDYSCQAVSQPPDDGVDKPLRLEL